MIKTFIPLLLALLLLLFVIWSGQSERQHLLDIHYAQIDAIEDFSQHLALEHLWLEEYQATGAASHLEQFREHREKAEGLFAAAKRLSREARDQDMEFHLRLEASLAEAGKELRGWQQMVDERLPKMAHAQVENGADGADARFDADFELLLQRAEQIEADVRQQLEAHLHHLSRQNFWIFAMAGLLVLLAIGYSGVAFRRQMEGMRRESSLRGRLDASEQKYRALFHASRDSVFVLDPDGHILDANANALKMFAYPVEEMRALDMCALYAEDESERCRAQMQLVGQDGGISFEARMQRKGGEEFIAEMSAGEFAIGEKKVVQAMVRDITLRKQAERELKASESRFRSLVDQSPFSIQIFSPDGMTLRVNRAWEQLWGVGGDFIRDYNVLQDEQLVARGVMPYMQRAFAGEVVEIPPVNYNPAGNTDLVGPASDRWVRAFAYPIQDGGGQVREVILMHEDITGKLRREEEIRHSRKAMAEAQRIAHTGSWELDLLHGSLNWSDEVFRIFEIDRERFAASYEAFLETVHPEDRAKLEEAYTRHLEEGAVYDIQHRLLFADGRIKYVHERCETERDAQGRALRSLGTVQDVTERVKAEQEKASQQQKMEHVQRLESLGVLAGGIAHDFNNLLTAIMGHAALARQQVDPLGGARESLLAIEETSKRAAELCRQMLAYSGKGKFVVQPVNLSEMARGMTRLLHVSLSKGVLLRDDLAENLPSIEADVAQMQQVIMNLVINANEAIGEKSGAIVLATGMIDADADYLHTVYVEEDELRPGRYVYLEVSDTGCGMDAATRARLFDPFFTTKFTGRGLGMSAILGIVRGHHGAIKVYTEPGKGTTFKVLFPMVDKDAIPLSASDGLPAEHRCSGTVLVVDDEDSIRTVAALMLERAGYRTMQAADGVEGVEMLRSHADGIDCVLLDMTMPRMDGEKAFTEMRRIKPDIRVLLSSGYNQQTATQRFTGKGLAGFVQKPYTPDVLLAAMAGVLKSKQEE